MQKDFHHAVTYVVSRLAGFDKHEADIIATSAQFVDDAVHSGTVFFKNYAAYNFITSAHKMVDYKNFDAVSNHNVWIPFHFLPANEMFCHTDQASEFVQRIVCRPNSDVSKEMLKKCFHAKDKSFYLHLIGVAMHVYIDTWAHQGFCGISHPMNAIEEIYTQNGDLDSDFMKRRNKKYRMNNFKSWAIKMLNKIYIKWLSKKIGEINPLGHGSALSYPDLPYLHWKYKDFRGKIVDRNNPKDFLSAVDHMYSWLVKFKTQNLDWHGPMNSIDRNKIEELIKSIDDFDGEVRHQRWCEEIKKGTFSFGAEDCVYLGEGENGWFEKAFKMKAYDEFGADDLELDYHDNFLDTDWKKIHDALFYFRVAILNEILPQYRICAA